MPRTSEEIAACKATAGEVRKWRLGVSITKAKKLRAKYTDPIVW